MSHRAFRRPLPVGGRIVAVFPAIPRQPAVILAAGCLLILLAGCSPAAAESVAEPQNPDLPELAAVGGAQDLWAFPFSLSATRSEIAQAYGEPLSRRGDDSRGGPGARIVEWDYTGVTLAFFVRADGSEEYLVSARISDASVPVEGPIQLGTPVEAVRELLGEPNVDTESRLVYFFSLTTIEIGYQDGAVTELTLGRSLP
jgi:hypothetical protein